jgi:hypothetical protein
MGPTVLLPPVEAVLRIFIDLKNISSSAGFEPANLWSNSKHDNHQITYDNNGVGTLVDMAYKNPFLAMSSRVAIK